MNESSSTRPPGRHREARPAGTTRPRRRKARLASTYRTTLYRMRIDPDKESLTSALNHRYLRDKDFTVVHTQVAGVPAILVHGSVAQPVADWCPVITELTGDPLTISHSSAGCALLMSFDGHVYAFTYGTLGRFVLDADRIDPGFGIAFAIRAIEPERIRRVTRRILASTGRVERSLVAGGQPIRRYGIEGWGEIVGQLCGVLANERLAGTRGGTRTVTIAFTDPAGLLEDLREIGRVCAGDSPSPELEFIAQVRPVPPGERTARLDGLLDGPARRRQAHRPRPRPAHLPG